MATKKLVHPILSMSTFAVTAPNDENRNNYQPPKKNDNGSDDNDDRKIAAKETAVKQELDSIANMSTTHVTKTTDEKKATATGTRRSTRPKRHVVYSDYADDDAGSDKKKRRRKQGKKKLIIDLKNVPMQVPILKHDGKKGGSSSKYLGVTWDKRKNKWRADVYIDGQKNFVGYYDNEEDAAVDYARAVYEYRGGKKGIKCLKAQQRGRASLEEIDLTDVPKQQLIMRRNGKGSSASAYKGVSFDKSKNKWKAQIRIDGTTRHVGSYDNEEDAAADYARAVFKYKGENAEVKGQDELCNSRSI